VSGSYVHDVAGEELDAIEVRVRISRDGFARLCTSSVPCSEVWLTEQPDGSFALGVVTAVPPEELGFRARAVERDDRRERFQ
jgi:hypothetical protein